MFDAIKKKLKEWVKSLAESNEEEFGGKKLECCGLNKEEKKD
jgi:hypothetical protein